ncbi:DUF4253 domain-containing protein [Actinomadura kijaniata]|uniref:DUF4253 domain-containing protein n=1 Tax=Actinomadura kijaniata TaxID=46161 RepID=UPI003F19ABE7
MSFESLPSDLPSGRLVAPDPDSVHERWAGRPVLWVSDEPLEDAGGLWADLYGRREKTGLYPLLLDGLYGEPTRPWHDGELGHVPAGAIDVLAADGVLRRFWDAVTENEHAAPLSDPWPGLADPGIGVSDPDDVAVELAEGLGIGVGRFLGLAPAGRGADTLSLVGWHGPLNHTNHTQEISAIVRSWEDRFGARVVKVGFDTLDLSVAAPPRTPEHARRVAAEHLAFCPDNVWQGSGDFETYAVSLVDAERWHFWWD